MIYLQLFIEFFKIGLFSFGGGYATIPFLYHISTQYGWYTLEELTQMTAVAAITPGAVGINIATYAGLKTSGVLGSLIATSSEMLPSLILVLIVCKILKTFKDNYYVKLIITTLKPISCALLTYVVIGLTQKTITNIGAIVLLLIFLILSWRNKKSPLFYILISAILGGISNIINF